jgi:nucleoside-diphosphate-sugar epimerase
MKGLASKWKGGGYMTVLVTGATGLLGSHVAERLVERGERPRVLIRPGDTLRGLDERHIEICVGDLTDRESLQAAVRGVERVIHCAARTGPWGPDAEYESVNVHGLKTLVDLAIGAGVKRFVHVSSITVHGNDVGGRADETTAFRVEPNPYSRSKVAAEQLLQRMIEDGGAPITIVRPGWIYGPRDVASFGRFATVIQQGKMVRIGSGDNHLPLIYVVDVAEGVLLASEAERAAGRAYLLVNDELVTQRTYLNAIAAELQVPAPARHVPYRLALLLGTTAETLGHLQKRTSPPFLMRYGVQMLGGENRFDITRARQELGFAPRTMLSEGVRRSVAWYRSIHSTGKMQEAA